MTDTRTADGRMSPQDVFHFFETVRITDLAPFRALCNALKAVVIDRAVACWRDRGRGRLSVADLGCGRGGDLRKWARYRLKQYVGIDGAAACMQEARERQCVLVAQGKSNLSARFHTADLTCEAIPLEDASMDVLSAMFFLQFMFCSEPAARACLREVRRVLAPNGVFCAVLPDGDRVHQLLQDRRTQVPFGHFRLRKLRAPAVDSHFGVGYDFSLGDHGCTEYIVSPRWLAAELQLLGFESIAQDDADMYTSAHAFFTQYGETESTSGVLKDQRCSHVDWLSLGFFTVVLARLAPATDPPATDPPATPAAQDPAPLAPNCSLPHRHRRSR